MRFELDLSAVRSFPDLPLAYDEELDSILSLFHDVFDALAETGSAKFFVSGFGQERWPVDIRVDLHIFLEQVPEAIAGLRAGAPFSIDFYEQGIERYVRFEPDGERYSATCLCGSGWTPSPRTEVIDPMELEKNLSAALSAFTEFLATHAPRAAAHPWVKEWARPALR